MGSISPRQEVLGWIERLAEQARGSKLVRSVCPLIFFSARVIICSPCCLGTLYVDQSDFELTKACFYLMSTGVKGVLNHT